jgi:hypothetical protein
MGPDWIDRLERRWGDWSIPNPAVFIVGMNAAIWGLSQVKPGFPALLALEPALIARGEWWRIATFLFLPPSVGPLFMLLWLYLLWLYAQALENEWGEFRFTVFYGIGAVATVAASLALGVGLSNMTLNSTIFLAFAALYPDFELLLFFILPVRVKWLAWITWALIALSFLTGGWIARAALVSGLLNYAVFFAKDHLHDVLEWRRRKRNRDKYGKAFDEEDR